MDSLMDKIKSGNNLKEIIDEYVVALLAFYDGADVDFTAAGNAIIDRFGRPALEQVKQEAKRIANS